MEQGKVSQEMFDRQKENIDKLQRLFPEVVKDGAVDFDALKEALGYQMLPGEEKYELTWAGKSSAKKLARESLMGKSLKFIPGDGKNEDVTENLYIEGDNLDVLKLLRENYFGAVKMIYIDPPYNTGNDFVYRDNFDISREESDINEGYASADGERYAVNTRSHNRYHATWLSSIYARLYVAKDLLTEDGVIFISIDNNEIANLKKVADEIFGEDSFVTILHVQMSTVQGQKVRAAKAGNIVKNGEYILVYSKNGEKAIGRRPLLDAVKYDGHYNKLLVEKGEGVFECHSIADFIKEHKAVCDELKALGLSKNGKVSSNSIQEYYEMSPLFRQLINENAKNIVRIHDSIDVPDSFKEKMEAGLVYLYATESREYLVCKNESGKIMQCIRLSEKIQVADDFYGTYGPTTIRGDWWAGFYLDMGNVSKEGEISYDNGKKPVRLIKQLIEFCTSDGDIVLDFYSGSATTAHAVFELELQLGEKRKFIMVQANEDLDESLDRADAENKKVIRNAISFLDSINKPHVLSELGKERIRRAGESLHEKYPEAEIDFGFKVFKVGETNIRWNLISNMDEIDIAQFEQNPDLIDFVEGYSDIDVVYEIILRQRNVELSEPLRQLNDIGNRTYLYANKYLICLETDMSLELIEKIAAINPLIVKYVFRDSAFKDDIFLKSETLDRLKTIVNKNSGFDKSTYTVEFI